MRHGLAVMAVMAVGWYLLLPPMTNDPNDRMRWGEIHTDKPLSQWEHEGSFDTAERCDAERLRNWDRAHSGH